MNFDINTFIAAAYAYLQSTFTSDWLKVKPIADAFFADKKARLIELTQSLSSGAITPEFFTARIKDEAIILESEAAALVVAGQVKTQDIVNTIADFIIQTALNLLIPPLG